MMTPARVHSDLASALSLDGRPETVWGTFKDQPRFRLEVFLMRQLTIIVKRDTQVQRDVLRHR